MADVVTIIQSFGEYLFIGLFAMAFLYLAGVFLHSDGLRAALKAWQGVSKSQNGKDAEGQDGMASHPILMSCVAVVAVWGLGIVFNAINYGALDLWPHPEIIKDVYADTATAQNGQLESPTSFAGDYRKRTVEDETVWRTESKEAAETMLNRSRLRVVRGALIGAPLLLLAWGIGKLRDSHPNAAKGCMVVLCIALYLPLCSGYKTLELEYHVAALSGRKEVSRRLDSETQKRRQEEARGIAEVAKLNAETSKLLVDAVAVAPRTNSVADIASHNVTSKSAHPVSSAHVSTAPTSDR